LAGLFVAQFDRERRNADSRREAYAVIDAACPQTYGGYERTWPWYSNWLHRLAGDQEPPSELTFLVFGNFSAEDDNTLAAASRFNELYQLWLGSEPEITDAGLDHIKRLSELRDLDLSESRLTVEAVEELRQALPLCKVVWNRKGPTPDERQSQAAPDQLR
jgi:hypothetical protein